MSRSALRVMGRSRPLKKELFQEIYSGNGGREELGVVERLPISDESHPIWERKVKVQRIGGWGV